jgi:ComF family protein
VIKQILKGFLGFALPNTCLSCEAVLNSGSGFICSQCSSKLVKFDENHPWKDEEITRGNIDDSFSIYRFVEGSEIQTLLHALKYEKMKSVGTMFGREIGARISKMNGAKFDFAVPVPLHRAKERERTYNQSLFICKGIGETLNVGVLDKCLKRNRFTETQTRLHKSQRKENVHGAFEINPKFKQRVAGKNIILADDVITTGATILECARVLKENGCGKILVCSAAYAVLH